MSEQDEILQKQTENLEAKLLHASRKQAEMYIATGAALGGKQSVTILAENLASLFKYVKAIEEAISPTLSSEGATAKAAIITSLTNVYAPIEAAMQAFEMEKAAFVPPNTDVDPLYPPESP